MSLLLEKIKKFHIPFTLIILTTSYFFIASHISSYRSASRKTGQVLYLPPNDLISLFSLDYKSLVSKILMVKANIYLGEHIDSRLSPDYRWLYKMYEASVTLDPYNIDTYFVAQAILPWDANLIKETNLMLKTGMKKRVWDWYLPFFVAFNYSYFLKDDKTAAKYFREAALLEPDVASVAGKYMQKAGETESALALLKIIHSRTNDKRIRSNIEKRIESLQNTIILEKAVHRYSETFNRLPNSFKKLISSGIIDFLPLDPYGKAYYIKRNGRVGLKTLKRPKIIIKR